MALLDSFFQSPPEQPAESNAGASPGPAGHSPLDDLFNNIGDPRWHDENTPVGDRIGNFLQARAGDQQEGPSNWQGVASELERRFPGVNSNSLQSDYERMQRDRGEQQRIAQARAENANATEGGEEWIARRSLPFVSTGTNLAMMYRTHESQQRINAGQGTPADYRLVAREEQIQRNRSNQSFAGDVGSFLTHLPAVLGELAVGSGLAKGAGTALAQVAPRAFGFLATEAAPNAPRLFTFAGLRSLGTREGVAETARLAPGYLGRTAIFTPLVPDFYAEGAGEANLAAGRHVLDPRGLPQPLALAYVNNLVIGSMGHVAEGIEGASVGRFLARNLTRAGVGVGEQAVLDVLTSASGLSTGYGVMGDIWRGDGSAAARHAALQGITFAAFGVMHEVQHGAPRSTHPVMEAMAEVFRDAHATGQKEKTVAEAVSGVNELLKGAKTPEQVEKIVEKLPEQLKNYGEKVAEAITPAMEAQKEAPPATPEAQKAQEPAQPAPTPAETPRAAETPLPPVETVLAPPFAAASHDTVMKLAKSLGLSAKGKKEAIVKRMIDMMGEKAVRRLSDAEAGKVEPAEPAAPRQVEEPRAPEAVEPPPPPAAPAEVKPPEVQAPPAEPTKAPPAEPAQAPAGAGAWTSEGFASATPPAQGGRRPLSPTMERMLRRQQAEKAVPAASESILKPFAEKQAPDLGAARALMNRASEQARALRAVRPDLAEIPPGAEPPAPRPKEHPDAWKERVLADRIEKFSRVIDANLPESAPTPENIHAIAEVLTDLTRMAAARGLDPAELVRQRLPQVFAELGESQVKEILHTAKEANDARLAATAEAKRLGLSPASVQRELTKRLSEESQVPEAPAESARGEAARPGESAEGKPETNRPGGEADNGANPSSDAGRGEAGSDELTPAKVKMDPKDALINRVLAQRNLSPFLRQTYERLKEGSTTAYSYVMGRGGLNYSSVAPIADVKRLLEMGLPKKLFPRKGGNQIDSLVEEMIRDGAIPPAPKGELATDHLLKLISDHYLVEVGNWEKREYQALQDQQFKESEYGYLVEQNPEWSRAQLDAEVARLIRESEKAGESEGRQGPVSDSLEEIEAVQPAQEAGGDAAAPVSGRETVNEQGELVSESGEVLFQRARDANRTFHFRESDNRLGAGSGGDAGVPGGTPAEPAGSGPAGIPASLGGTGKQSWIGRLVDDFKSVFAPASRGPEAAQAAGIIRKNLSEMARKKDQVLDKLQSAKAMMDRMPEESRWQFVDAMEAGKPTADKTLQPLADVLRQVMDQRREQVQALGTGALAKFIDNYFPHIWKDPAAAENAFEKAQAESQARRPLEGSRAFLKERTIPTIAEGRALGLEPVSSNPIELVFLKMFQVDRYVMAHNVFNELKAAGLTKFFKLSQRATDGWTKFDDRLSKVFAPPVVDVKEYYDKRQMEGLEKFADSLGIDVQRTMRGPLGSSGPGKKVQTRFGTPEEVLAHEIGHQLDVHYDMTELHKNAAMKDELTELARHRLDENSTPAEQGYAMDPREKVANLVAAFLHAPELAREVAPKATEWLSKFLDANPKFQPLKDVKPSLLLGERTGQMRLAGPMLTGNYFMPEPVALLLNNYLSPGFRGNMLFDVPHAIGGVMNQFQLGFSGYHLGFVAMDSIVSSLSTGVVEASRGNFGEAGKLIGKSVASPVSKYLEGMKIEQEWLKPGSQGGDYGMLVNALVHGGARAHMDKFYGGDHIEKFMTAYRESQAGEKGKAGILATHALPAISELLSKPLMEKYVPRMKLGVAAEMLRAELAHLGPDASSAKISEVAGKVWDIVEDRMGQMTYDNLFWNRMLKDTLMASVRSVGWNLGSFRAISGGIKDIPASVGGVLKGEGISQRTAYLFVALPAATAVFGTLYQLMMTGKAPEELKDVFFPKTGRTRADGSPDRVSLPSYMKDIASLLNRADEGPFRIGENIGTMAKHKASPILSLMGEMISNEDFYGTAIRDPHDPIMRQTLDEAKHILGAFEPFATRAFRQQRDQGASIGTSLQGFGGITPAPAYVTRSSEQQRAIEGQRRVITSPLERHRREQQRQ